MKKLAFLFLLPFFANANGLSSVTILPQQALWWGPKTILSKLNDLYKIKNDLQGNTYFFAKFQDSIRFENHLYLSADTTNYLLVKLDLKGKTKYSKVLHSSNHFELSNIAFKKDSAFLGCTFRGTFNPSNSLSLTSKGGYDIAVLNLDENGDLSSFFQEGADGDEILNSFAFLNSGELLLTGGIQQKGTFGSVPHFVKHETDFYLACYSLSNNLNWIEIGEADSTCGCFGPGSSYGDGLVTDTLGNIFCFIFNDCHLLNNNVHILNDGDPYDHLVRFNKNGLLLNDLTNLNDSYASYVHNFYVVGQTLYYGLDYRYSAGYGKMNLVSKKDTVLQFSCYDGPPCQNPTEVFSLIPDDCKGLRLGIMDSTGRYGFVKLNDLSMTDTMWFSLKRSEVYLTSLLQYKNQNVVMIGRSEKNQTFSGKQIKDFEWFLGFYQPEHDCENKIITSTDTNKQLEFKIIPNPVSSDMKIVSSFPVTDIVIRSSFGELVKHLKGENLMDLSIGELSKGVYFITALGENVKPITQKIIKY